MKVEEKRLICSKDFGFLYSDVKTKQLRHRFPAKPTLDEYEFDQLCFLDMSADDIKWLGFNLTEEEGWIVRVPVGLFCFEQKKSVIYNSRPVPLFYVHRN